MKKLFIVFALISFIQKINAQTQSELFSEIKSNKDELQEAESKALEKVKNKLGKNDGLIVKLSPIQNSFKKNKYEFTLPITGKKVKVLPVRTEYTSEKDYTIFGKMEDNGDFIFSSKNDQKVLHINFEGYIYDVYPLENDSEKHVLIRHDKKFDPPTLCGITSKESPKNIPDKNTGKGARVAEYVCDDSDKLRVMVLYTQNASNAVPNIFGLATNCINQFNSACWNSSIGNVQAELVGPFLLSNFSSNSNLDTELDNLANNMDVQTLRSDNKADLVVLFGTNYSTYTTKTRNYDANLYNSYVVAEVSQVEYKYGFVHALSHLLSTRHEQCSVASSPLCDDNHPFSHAWGFQTYNWWSGYKNHYTVEYSNSSAGYNPTTILHFSNPNVSYNGNATGTANNDNAQRMNETFPTVRGYYRGPGELKAYINLSMSSPGYFEPYWTYQPANTTYIFDGTASCGQAPYYNNWQISSDGINFTTVSTSASYSVYLGEYDYKVIRLIVNSTDLQTAYKTVTLTSLCSGCRVGSTEEQVNVNNSNESTFKSGGLDVTTLKVSPNPAKNILQVSFNVPKEGQVKIDVIDLQGKTANILSNKKYPIGTHTVKYECPDNQAGTYVCKMELDGVFVTSDKFIIEK